MADIRAKARYSDPDHPCYSVVMSPIYRLRTLRVFHHVLNLYRMHQWERAAWGGRVVRTDRYREWQAKRDA